MPSFAGLVMSGKKKKVTGKGPIARKLPKHVRDELRMTCALRGYSHIKCGVGKKLAVQQKELAKFFHGQPPHHPSQVKLLAQGSYTYRELYEEELSIVKKKGNDKGNAVVLNLKQIFAPGCMLRYRCGIDINHIDLEKSLRTGKALLSGRKILDMARRGVKSYKKALSFCSHKWDLKKGAPIESGDSIDDIVEYVREKMYELSIKEKGGDDNSVSSEDNDATQVVDREDEPSGVAGGISNGDTEDQNDADTEFVLLKVNDNTTATDESGGKLSVDAEQDVEVPDDYMFPSFIVLMLYGPFVAPDQQLMLLLTDDSAVKKGDGTRKKQRKEKSDAKQVDAAHDTSAVRGFSTDQRIDIEKLNVQQSMMKDKRDETAIVALSIEESALARMLAMAEKRAEVRCPMYDENNIHWQRVDSLIEDHSCVMERIKSFNKMPTEDTSKSNVTVSDFLKEASPTKISKKRSIVDIDEESSEGDSDSEEEDATSTGKKTAVSP